ncbi:MAG: helix-turn-helix transcriptional regulator, partial [Flavisolibacter sp.]|nr:helix-turn-helix transcriptional regulator [Flavisolibacter sp.]
LSRHHFFPGYNPLINDSSQPGEKVKWYRYEHDLSQKVIKKLIGVDASTIAYIEVNQCSLRSKALQKALEFIKDKENQ